MSEIPKELKYTDEHEWIRMEGDTAVVGITDYAQDKLGEVIYVELPETGKSFSAKEVMATVESVKAVSDIYAPLSGEITEVNQAVVDDPALLNRSPYGEAWLVKIRVSDPSEADSLLPPEKYAEITKE